MSDWRRRDFMRLLGLGGIGLAIGGCTRRPISGLPVGESSSGKAKRPNVVILLADDLGWNDVGYHGSDIATPNIDAFVKQGVELNRFYSCPVCSPTRGSLMTGRYPHRYGLPNAVIPPWRDFGISTDEVFMPEYLSKAGYEQRACIGKWHMGHSDVRYHPLNRGFTSFYGHYNGAIDYFTHEREGELDWHRNFETSYDKGYSTELLTQEAVSFIQHCSGESPFLLYVPFNAPHGPLQAKKKDLLKCGFDKTKGVFGGKDKEESRGRGNDQRQTYAAMVLSMDRGIGEILSALDKKGISENTLVLFFSDNGGTKGPGGDNKPLNGHKGTVWEGGVRVPAAIRWPEVLDGGQRFEGVMGSVDVLPTLLSLAEPGLKPRNELDGIDMMPYLTASKPLSNREYYLGDGALVTQEWKLINGQLFEIEKDPNETADVAEEHPEVAARLGRSLKEYEALGSTVHVGPYSEGREGFIAPKEWKMEDYPRR